MSFASKFKLHKSPVTSVLLCSCETWVLPAESEERIQAFEAKCLRKLLCISHLKHETNDWVQSKINCLAGPQEAHQATERQELETCMIQAGHVQQQLSKTLLNDTLEGQRRHGQRTKCWMDNVKEWTPLPMPEPLPAAQVEFVS